MQRTVQEYLQEFGKTTQSGNSPNVISKNNKSTDYGKFILSNIIQ